MAWEHPEWWMLALSLCAWVLLVPRETLLSPTDAAHDHMLMLTSGGVGHGTSGVSWSEEISHWTIMVAAMMFPAIVGPVRITANRSLWHRRHRAVAGFLVGYGIPWLALGLAWFGLLFLIGFGYRGLTLSPPRAVPYGIALAVIWQFTPLKRRALASCHATMPLAPRGWPANRDCLRYGLLIGRGCVLSCWALMLVPMLASHSVLVMAAVTAVAIGERYYLTERRVAAALWSSFWFKKLEASA